MECREENLQMYLDGELDAQTQKRLEEHFSRCRSCRQEIARLQLLWLELGQPLSIAIPKELPYLGQQTIHQVVAGMKESTNSEAGYWEAQKLAWQPAMMGASHLPGVGILSTVGRATRKQIPRLLSGTVSLTRRLIFPPADKKGGRR